MKKGRNAWVKHRHQVVHDLVYYPVKLLLFLLYGLRTEKYLVKRGARPCLILSNHTTPLDAVCLGTSFDFPIYYVASDHVFRQGWVSRLLKWLVAPIPIVKSRMDLRTIKEIITVAAEGGSVSIFPEGNRNFNGEPVPFSPSIAKLAKKLNMPLVLYRFEGGYFTAPRWADSIRRGRMTGRTLRVISPEEMDAISAEELNGLIKDTLYVNAYDEQEKNPVRYRGARPAEALERALYLCPGCRGMATLKSEGDLLQCACGIRARYNDFGFFEPAGDSPPPFKTVREWDRWQKSQLPEWLRGRLDEAKEGEALVSDEGQRLLTCGRAGSDETVGEGLFALHADRFAFTHGGGTLDFPLEAVSKVIIHGKQALQFTCGDGSTWEVKSKSPHSALKYLNLFELLRNKNGEVPDGLFSL